MASFPADVEELPTLPPLGLPTLPLSGRHGSWGGKAESLWWPVHSRGLLDVAYGAINRESLSNIALYSS